MLEMETNRDFDGCDCLSQGNIVSINVTNVTKGGFK